MKSQNDPELDDELRPEYKPSDFRTKGVRGKYASRYRQGTNVVLLEPDVAKVFPTEEAVNEALRMLIKIAETSGGRKKTRKTEAA